MKVSHLCARDIATVASTEAVGDRNFSLTAMPISPVYEGQPRRKRSTGKATWPGIKQVWRSRDRAGCFAGDVLALASDVQPGEPLLQPAMRGGLRTGPAATLAASRACAASVSRPMCGQRGSRNIRRRLRSCRRRTASP